MEPVEYFRALRNWWWIVAAAVFIGLAAAWVTTPSSTTDYEATRTLKVDVSETAQSENALARLAFDVTNGDVPIRAANRLAVTRNPTLLAEEIETSVDPTVQTLTITAVDQNPDDADELAGVFAEELQASVEAEAARARMNAVEDFAALTEQIDLKEDEIGAVPDDSPAASRLGAELSGLLEDRAVAEDETDAPADFAFEEIAPTEPVAVGGRPDRIQRMTIAGLVGLLLGVGLALVFARFDPRIRMKEQAERAFSLPVLAEIPVLPRRRRRLHEIVTVSDPESLAGQAYRSLRTSLLLKPTPRHRERLPQEKGMHAMLETHAEGGQRSSGAQVVVVASPGMGEGKTTTTANLAAAFAETGRRVLVLECDLRRPTLGSFFGVAEGPGLTDALARSGEQIDLDGVIRTAAIPRVKVVTAGRPVANPDELLTRVSAVVDVARRHADVVVIDTAPLLSTDDASVIVPFADDVVVVCRVGRTPIDAAERATELLTRLGAPITGVILVGATVLPSTRSYYRADHRFWQPQRHSSRIADAKAAPNGRNRDNSTTGTTPANPPRAEPRDPSRDT